MLSFGKYKDKNLADIVSIDIRYSKWLLTQPWFYIKFPDIHKELLNELNKINNSSTNNSSNSSNSFIIYTDGACKNNGSHNAKAGIGIHFSLKNKIKLNDISEKLICEKPTNNKAELTAILKALQLCNENNINENIIIYTDSD